MMNDSNSFIRSESFIKELKAGKERAFDLLFRNRYEPLCRFAWSFVSDYSVAEDIVQDLFSNIWRKSTAIDENRSLDSYLYVSVRNACYTYLKNSKQNVSVDALAHQTVEPEFEVFNQHPGIQKLWNAVETLPLQCKVVFKLVVLEELKYQEVAEKLDVSVNTVKTQMKIAYKILRSRFSKDDVVLLLLLLKRPFVWANLCPKKRAEEK